MEGIAELLKNAREEAGISIEEVSRDLGISELILKNIEEGHIGAFKDIFEIKSYVIEYAKYLGFEEDMIIDKFNEYLFEYTSKIPVSKIEKAIKDNKDDDKEKIVSPYTMPKIHEKKGTYLLIYLLIILLVIFAIYWSINQITVEKKNAYVISYRK